MLQLGETQTLGVFKVRFSRLLWRCSGLGKWTAVGVPHVREGVLLMFAVNARVGGARR